MFNRILEWSGVVWLISLFAMTTFLLVGAMAEPWLGIEARNFLIYVSMAWMVVFIVASPFLMIWVGRYKPE